MEKCQNSSSQVGKIISFVYHFPSSLSTLFCNKLWIFKLPSSKFLIYCPLCLWKFKGNVFMSLLWPSHPGCPSCMNQLLECFMSQFLLLKTGQQRGLSYGSLWWLRMTGSSTWSWAWHPVCSQYDWEQWLACITRSIGSASSLLSCLSLTKSLEIIFLKVLEVWHSGHSNFWPWLYSQ